jgi:hypothetical protein
LCLYSTLSMLTYTISFCYFFLHAENWFNKPHDWSIWTWSVRFSCFDLWENTWRLPLYQGNFPYKNHLQWTFFIG